MKEYRFHVTARWWSLKVKADSDAEARDQIYEYFKQVKWEFGGDDSKGACLRKLVLELKEEKEVK